MSLKSSAPLPMLTRYSVPTGTDDLPSIATTQKLQMPAYSDVLMDTATVSPACVIVMSHQDVRRSAYIKVATEP